MNGGTESPPGCEGEIIFYNILYFCADALKVVSKTVCAAASWHSEYGADETRNKHQSSRINSFSEFKNIE